MSKVLAIVHEEWLRVGDVAPLPPLLHGRLPVPIGQPLVRRRLHALRKVERVGWEVLARHHLPGVEPG